MRNRGNLATTLLEAPALAVLVATVLRYSEEGAYNFASAFHIPTYLFLTLVIGLFLGLTNSAEEIIRDRTLLERERNQGIRVRTYVLSKLLSLGIFAFAQCVIYLLIGDAILGIRDMFWHNLFWMFLTAFVGVTVGLLISSVVSSSKTALNIIPLILIPNIILGGALIKYEEMNRGFDILGNLDKWLGPAKNANEEEDSASDLKVPAICELMPLRWAYEAVIISHADRNPVNAVANDLNTELDMFPDLTRSGHELSTGEEERLDRVKAALTTVYSLRGPDAAQVSDALRDIVASLEDNTFSADDYRYEESEDAEVVTAEQLYLNGKVLDLFNRAKIEIDDYRRQHDPPNVFFGPTKHFSLPKIPRQQPADPSGESSSPASQESSRPDFYTIDTLLLNGLALGCFALLAIAALHVSLSRQLRRV